MKKKGLNEIRKDFRDFFVSKGHYPAKSASLIPQGDKSLLIINSGMAPLKKFFSGEETPPSKRMTTCQKCIRTGDIENVGKTSRHGTFFEMMGNFSFGDYFKKESLNWGWEFITKVLEMDPERIWATVYQDDEEAVKIWKEIGLPDERIVRLGKEDNFWEIGLGPCGPDSEIFYDRGEAYGCGCEDCKPGCDCDRYIEFWNHVFTQFSKEEDGSYSDLAHPNIDTGMGLERMACIMQDVTSIFDIDTVRYILDGVLELSGKKYAEIGTEDTDISVRIITDHLRSMVFMIGDGIIPSNEGRGYVLRRLIRRAARHGRILGIESGFLSSLADRVIKVSGDAYPELIEKKDFIKKIISVEEEKFETTIDQGIEIISGYIEEMKKENSTILDGDRIFKLYDTYGFPPELTEEILEENGFSADLEGFDINMKKQREMARAGRHVDEEEGWKKSSETPDVQETVFTGYDSLVSESEILAMVGAGGEITSSYEGEEAIVYLDKSPFYAESGGQIYDTGIMYTSDAKAQVVSVTKKNGVFAHRISVISGTFEKGMPVTCKVDAIRRNLTARNHTATHLLHKALKDVLGTHVQQAGSSVTGEMLRFDFTHFEAMSEEEKTKVEDIVNEKIMSFLPVSTLETSMDDAVKRGATALFGEKYGNVVRMVSCGDFSIELCGGTHAGNTGELGAFKIISESGVAAGVRRIEAITAASILKLLTETESVIDDASKTLKCNKSALLSRIASLNEENKSLNKELEEINRSKLGDAAEELVSSAKEINGIKLITKRFDGSDINSLRDLTDDIKKSAKTAAMVFAAVNDGKVAFLVALTDDLVDRGMHAGKMVKEIAATCGGGGGGKANMAQAGAKDISNIDKAFEVAETFIK